MTPDVIIFIVNPYQAMRIQQGLNSTPLCPSIRFLAKWKDEEMAVGIPYEKFKNVVEGVIATINTTDIKRRKEEIKERFASKNKTINLDD